MLIVGENDRLDCAKELCDKIEKNSIVCKLTNNVKNNQIKILSQFGIGYVNFISLKEIDD